MRKERLIDKVNRETKSTPERQKEIDKAIIQAGDRYLKTVLKTLYINKGIL